MKTFITLTSLSLFLSLSERTPAADLIQSVNFQGGLLVHVDCGDGTFAAELYKQARASAPGGFLFQGLEKDPENVSKARKRFEADYGRAAVDAWSGDRLPLIDNQVNLLVVENAKAVSESEILRVLAPEGTACIRDGKTWRNIVKPRPADIDEWTHYMHSPGNNAVAHDRQVGPPRHLQWVGSPRWTRHHDHMSSFNAMVTAGGRVFYIVDLGLRAEVQLPPDWTLVARDAFNGVILWKKKIEKWHTQLWPLKSGPALIPRRLVAEKDRVYVTMGLDAPVSVLDAASGRELLQLKGTKGTEEILHADGTLYLVVNPQATPRPWATKDYETPSDVRSEPEQWAWKDTPRKIVAADAGTGTIKWKKPTSILPMTLTVDDGQVYYHDGARVVALCRDDGKPRWRSKPVKRAQVIRSWFAPTLVVQDDVLVFSGGEKILRHKGGVDSMTALSATNGDILWTAPHPASGYDSPEDVFIIDGLVWTAPITNKRDTGKFTGRDLRTGEVKQSFPADDGTHMPHHRCHRAKATDQYIVASRTGIEYVDLKAKHWDRNDWVRGACLYGVVPANGLTYSTPHSCACYIVAKLSGLNALAARRPGVKTNRPPLEKGPGFKVEEAATKPGDWPTFRANPARSGHVETQVPTELKRSWATSLGGRLSSPVAAGGRVFVAQIDAHTVHALSASTGKTAWTFTAGGRVDSPPTIWNGRVLFGSNDGFIYCLRASDGALARRFRAAPEDLRLQAWEQLESVWPVHGSVLVFDGEVHGVAGRSMFLDGGLRYLRLDAETGDLLSERSMSRMNPDTGKPLDAHITWPNLPVALPDILSYDGRHVYLRSQVLDTTGKRITVKSPTSQHDQKGETAHLFCPTGLLDDSWWHRTYWIFGKNPMSGAGGWYRAAYQGPTGRTLVFDDQRVYAFGRRPQYFPRTTALEYHLYASARQPKIVPLNPKQPKAKSTAKSRRGPASRPDYDWSHVTPVIGRALVKAGDTLFVAGPPDVVDQEASFSQMNTENAATALARQSDAYLGRSGGFLLAVSAGDGTKRTAYRLDTIPVFNGLAAAGKRLFMTTVDGRVLGLGAEGESLPKADNVGVKATPPIASTSAGAPPMKKHKDFDHIKNVRIDSGKLGWRVRAPTGGVGLALRKLDKPLAGPVTFKMRLKMFPNTQKDKSKPAPGNAFLAFGDKPEDAALIKCGLRNAEQSAQVTEGPLMTGRQERLAIPSKVNEVIELTAIYDPASGKVTSTLYGKTIETTIKQKPKEISWIGYMVQSVASEFGPIEISGQ